MAIKGKKKSQSRGSQGSRRPAQAPRPVASSRRGPTPFYRTRDGILLLGIFGAVALAVVIWAIVNARSNAADTQKRADALDDYTSQVRAVLQEVSPVAAEMTQVAPAPSPDLVAGLEDDTKTWLETLQGGREQLGGIAPPEDAEHLQALFEQSIGAYLAAADAYVLVPGVDDKLQPRLLAAATAQRDRAGALAATAILALDDERSDLGLDLSGIQAPSKTAPVAPQPSVPPLSPSTP